MPLAPIYPQEPIRSIPRLVQDFFKPLLVASAHGPKPADANAFANSLDKLATTSTDAHPADFHAAAQNKAYTPAGKKDDGETPAALETTLVDDPAPSKSATHPAKEGVVNQIATAHDATPPNDVVCATTIIEGLLSSHAAPVVQFAQAWHVQVADNIGASPHAATPDGTLDLLAANPVESIIIEADILLAPCCHDAFPATKYRVAFNSAVLETTIQAFLESLVAEEPALVKSIHAWPLEVATHQATIHAPESPQQLAL
ncbi:hypothetical protein GOP47_0025344 [Adiantum capillus-veneris]|uniref:Uncharacterized protein n=1 Tax=Adiantum capillus-veneris TaxID=13818 RepID=A0A9D4U1B3_ADICA|nr:hypothetical protein GOP47_0025344 [Adiantum capillus-veneris]